MIGFIYGIGGLCAVPFMIGLFLMALYVIYCLVFAWLSIIPIFKGHFRFMCKVWYCGLAIVSKTWKVGIVGLLINWITSGFIK